MSRKTTTGQVLEQMVIPALEHGGYHVEKQVEVGDRPGGKKHKVDVFAKHSSTGRRIIVSLKWQQVSGTAEQKVPYEVISLLKALKEGQADVAYLVLGGSEGWTLKDFYLSGELAEYIRGLNEAPLHIVTLEEFIAMANKGVL